MKRAITLFSRLCEAYLPDPFAFGLILTLVVFALGLIFTPHGAAALIEFWGKDFWSMNTFAMQMIFVLVSGNMLATAPLIKKILAALTGQVRNETTALIFLSVFSIITCWFNWGFGLIVSGIFAIELARKLGKVNFGLFVATAYAGFLVWHGGLSGSIPLRIAGDDEILQNFYPGLKIPLHETVFAEKNLLIVALLMIALPLTAILMKTDEKHEVEAIPPQEELPEQSNYFRDRLERSYVLNIIFFGFFLWVIYAGMRNQELFDINRLNFIFLFSALLLHKTPRRFLASLNNSFGHASGLAILFPFYAGIMGLMHYSGLGELISEIFVKISTPRTLPLWAFLSGGIVNFFVPSGGGQWVVQGPIMLKAALDLGVSPSRIAMAIAWGDAWTNMIQPLWAIPLLALARLQLKEIMGYCLIYLLVSGLIIISVLLF